MMVLKFRLFHKWARSEKLTDKLLRAAVEELSVGLVDANLGGGLYKKRVAKKGMGKRGGYRTILTLRKNDRVIFLFGFSKNERENIDDSLLVKLKEMAKLYLNLTDSELQKLIEKGELIEVK
jgi:hypothetical protein